MADSKSSVTFLSSSPGRVVALQNKAMTASLRLQNFGGFEVVRAIITQVAVSAEISMQVQSMLGGNIYVYVFGEKPGGIMIRGIAMEQGCSDTEGEVKGIKELNAYYNENNAYARATPIKLTIGTDLTIIGYITGLQYSVADPRMRLWEYTLKMVTIPESAIAANKARAGDIVTTTTTTTDEEVTPTGPTLPDVEVSEGGDNGGADFTDNFAPLVAGSGYSAYGTGPTLDLVQTQR